MVGGQPQHLGEVAEGPVHVVLQQECQIEI